jgi:hypothetical protein
MSVRKCEFPTDFDGKPFREDIEPVVKSGKTYINPQVITQKYATDFNRISINSNYCPKIQYTSPDPRLISAAHNGQVLTLSTPPISGDVNLNTLLDDTNLDHYGQRYKSYRDVNAGQILYHIDKSREDPFNYPNFTTSATATGVVYKDPMGGIKPKYTRTPLIENNHLGPTRDNYEGGFSWMEDSSNFRQDIMALQMRKYNQERYAPRWYGY